MSGVIKDAGKTGVGPVKPSEESPKRARILMAARILRAAQTDEEAADALEAAIELAKE